MSNDRSPEGEEQGRTKSENDDEVIIERRIDRRLRRIEETDWPRLRRVVGAIIILVSLYFAWKVGHQDGNKLESTNHLPVISSPVATNDAPPVAVVGSDQQSDADDQTPFLNAMTLETISDCTKGVDTFRSLEFGKNEASGRPGLGSPSLDSVFSPILDLKLFKQRNQNYKRQINLLNIRIRSEDGREVRLHVVPEGQSGHLKTRLFGVDQEGLPDPDMRFSPEIEKFRGVPYSHKIEENFLKLAKTDADLLETEVHESYSYPDHSGVQLIKLNKKIVSLQAYMSGKFLACSVGKEVVCQCQNK